MNNLRYWIENASKASIYLRNQWDLRESFLELMALQWICKSFTAEVTKEYAKFTKLNFEALCFNEDAELKYPVFHLCFSHLKTCYIRVTSEELSHSSLLITHHSSLITHY